uniref:iron-sulfur cluster assembly accessory protein n=1 Tax=Thaumasiovibrio occultus TaxID=1891184 RepID=UPI000B357210|nr:iron-sulfur cluster assembly accessory protein [Thaumasiovibrio occultus]
MSKDTSLSQSASLDEMSWQGLTLTQAAADQIQKLTPQGNKHFHISIKVSGCTGYAYVVQLIDAPSDDDIAFESHGCTFYAALTSMPFVDGTEVDYVSQGLNQAFVYHNPKVKNQCGCGESFGV